MKELIHIRNAEGDAVPPEEKENLLLAQLSELPSLIVALSGGADSAYLASAAHGTLAARALSVTALSPRYSPHDRAVLDEFVTNQPLPHAFIDTPQTHHPPHP